MAKRAWLFNGRSARVLPGAVFVSALAACGGGIQEDSQGEADRLVCATTCKPSSTLATSEIRPSFAVVSDGTRVQAQAAFSSGGDFRFNVEVDGSDSLRLRTSQGTQGFHIPGSNLVTVFADVLRTLVAGATPYLSEVSPSAAAASMQFEFVRGTTVHASSVQLPAPYQILSPANGATLAISTRTLQVSLTSPVAAIFNNASFNCADANGNTANGTLQLAMTGEGPISGPSGVSYVLDVGRAIDGLSFSTTQPRGTVSRCDVVLKLIVQTQGQADPRFGTAQVFAQQIRSVTIAMR